MASLHDPYMPISGPSLSSLPYVHRIVTKLLHHQCLVSSVLLFCGSIVLVEIYLDVFLRNTKLYLKRSEVIASLSSCRPGARVLISEGDIPIRNFF